MRTCPCLGGTQGVQVCADDGTRWGACQCAAADAGVTDGAAALDGGGSDGGCVSTCATAGVKACSGSVLTVCTEVSAGCLQATTCEDRAATPGLTCDDSLTPPACGPQAYCTATGAACSKSVGCPTTTISGFCVERDDVSGNSRCAYGARFAGGETVTCEGETVAKCSSGYDCPGDACCSTFGSNWCETDVAGLCSRGFTALPCTSDADCDFTPSNDCVACGDGTLDSPQEECDDGNVASGDGCSPTCQFTGTCVASSSYVTTGKCATAADCAAVSECLLLGPCTCRVD